MEPRLDVLPADLLPQHALTRDQIASTSYPPRTRHPKVIHSCGQRRIRSLDPNVDEIIDSRIHNESMTCSEALGQ